MNIPFKPFSLFESNEFLEINQPFPNVIVVDNWYKKYDEIFKLLENTPLHIWKEYYPSKNFINYYDCKLNIPLLCASEKSLELNFSNLYKGIFDLCEKTFCDKNEKVLPINKNLSFNFYKNIEKNVDNKNQLYPHKEDYINCIFYMDRICSGGTALYPKIKNNNFVDYHEEENILVDISNFEKIIIKSKPNRIVLFDGNTYHGGYINNHNDYLKDWRITQTIFLKKYKNYYT